MTPVAHSCALLLSLSHLAPHFLVWLSVFVAASLAVDIGIHVLATGTVGISRTMEYTVIWGFVALLFYGTSVLRLVGC